MYVHLAFRTIRRKIRRKNSLKKFVEKNSSKKFVEKNDHQSRFLEAPFVRMLRMRSASLKINGETIQGRILFKGGY